MSDVEDITVYRLAARFDDEYPDSEARWVAERAARSIRAPQRMQLLVDLLADEIDGRRRARARVIERNALLTAAADQQRAEWTAAREENERLWQAQPWLAPRNTRHYRRWAATPEGQQREERRLQEQAAREERDRLARDNPVEYERRYGLASTLNRIVDEVRNEAKLELTAELLGSTFALGNGRVTTWGAASIADHETRLAMLTRQIEGNALTATLHEKAIELIREHEASCLNEVRFAA